MAFSSPCTRSPFHFSSSSEDVFPSVLSLPILLPPLLRAAIDNGGRRGKRERGRER